MTITLDATPKEFKALQDGSLNFFMVKENKDYDVNDTVIFHEKDGDKYTGQEHSLVISYIIGDSVALRKDYRCIGLKPKEV